MSHPLHADPTSLTLQLRNAYGSFEEPCYDFLERVRGQQPYAKLEAELRQRYEIVDTTDFNTDSALILGIESGSEVVTLMLSLAAIAAILCRPGTDHLCLVEKATTATEQSVVSLLTEHAVPQLSAPLLSLSSGITNIQGDGELTFFQALFSDSGDPPKPCVSEFGK
jgi:hypothetical protein